MKVKTNESEMKSEVESLRAKNEEYRKALNIFREKLNEVAVFNSNLAYATRLFTEHTTTKQEKINILRRFDSVETLRESKTLYKTLKEEFESKESTSINESVESKVAKTPSRGASTNLIESKTYENPQFLRMKDLMNKLK
jgi:predicted nuclease with TOPRIM domain